MGDWGEEIEGGVIGTEERSFFFSKVNLFNLFKFSQMGRFLKYWFT
jgi:hypothetical protein